MPKVSIGGNERTLHEFNGRKAIRAAKIVRGIGEAWPEILSTIAAFRSDYEAKNAVVMDRATARQQFPLIPVMDPDDAEGEKPLLDDAGKPVYYDRLGHLTEADWAASDHKLRLPKTPSREEVMAAAFPVAFDRAEAEVLQLLALCTIDADKLGEAARANGSEAVTELLNDEADELLDQADLGELLELAVVGSEMVERQVREKVEALGDRVGNLLRLAGLGRASSRQDPAAPTDASSTTSPPSSTSSDPSTDGASDEPSTALAGASSAPSSGE